MDIYNPYPPGGAPVPDPVMMINEQRRRERHGLFVNAMKLGILLLMYEGLTYVMNRLYFIALYVSATGSFTLDTNEIRKYLSDHYSTYSSSFYSMLGNLSIVSVSVVVLFVAARVMFKISLVPMLRPKAAYFSGGIKWFSASMSINVLVSFVVGILVYVLGTIGVVVPESDFSMTDSSLGTLIMQFLYVVAIGPVCEEFIYRGLVITLLKPYGKGLAVFFSAFIFGLMHGNIPQFAATFAGGLVFAAVAVKYDSIVPTLVMHILNNIAASIYDFTDVLGISRSTAGNIYNSIVIVCMVFGLYMLIVHFRQLRPSEEKRFSLTSGQRRLAVFSNIAMLVYFGFIAIKYIRSFMMYNQ